MASTPYQGSFELVITSGLFLASSVFGCLFGNRKVASYIFIVWFTSWLYHWPKPDYIPNDYFKYIDITSNAILTCWFLTEIWPDKRLRIGVWTVVCINVLFVLNQLYFKPNEDIVNHMHALCMHVPWYITFAYCHYVHHSDMITTHI